MLSSTNDIKQELSYTYVRALATKVGYSMEEVRVDRDSVDVTLCARGKVLGSTGRVHSPKLDLQLKATTRELSGDPIPFALSMKNYEDLRVRSMVPKVLMVLFLPKEEDQWVCWDETQVVLHGEAYWLNLLGSDPVTNAANKTVYIPKTNRFSDLSLKQMMIAVANKEWSSHASR